MNNKVLEAKFLDEYKKGVITFEMKSGDYIKSLTLPKGGAIFFTSLSYYSTFRGFMLMENELNLVNIGTKLISFNAQDFKRAQPTPFIFTAKPYSCLSFKASEILTNNQKISIALSYHQKRA